MRGFALTATAFALLSSAHACIWDVDTLAQEAKGQSQLIRVLTGRFERNPPLYYQMRLARVSAELERRPDELALYDDAGVACDRLGRSDEAIAWMARKLARLEALGPKGGGTKEHLYRYHANLGTFWMHRWLKQGAPKKDLGQVREARDHIARAIAINPNAHFGRETVQLDVMDWIIHTRTKKLDEFAEGSLGEWMRDESRQSRGDDALRGLAGLVHLGNAWESVDVFEAIASLLVERMDSSLAYVAGLRARELLKEGRRSLGPKGPTAVREAAALNADYLKGELQGMVRDQFDALRQEADQWHDARTRYMLTRLKAGRHPDTDSTFWREYHDTEPPAITAPPNVDDGQASDLLLRGVAAGLVAVAPVAFLVWRRRDRRAQTVPFVQEPEAADAGSAPPRAA